MKLYQMFPYIDELNVNVTERKTVRNKLHLATDKTLFCPGNRMGQPADTGFFDDFAVSDVYEDKGIVYHVLEEKPRKNSFVQKIDMKSRFDHMQQYMAATLYAVIFEKLYSISAVRISITDTETLIDLNLKDRSLDCLEVISVVMSIVNDIISRGLEVKTNDEEDFSILIESVGSFKFDGAPVSSTSELICTQITSYKSDSESLSLCMLAGNRCIAYMNERIKSAKELKQLLGTDDSTLTEAVKELLEENKSLRNANNYLKRYMFSDYIQKMSIPTYYIDGFSITNHIITEPNLQDLFDFIEEIESNIVILAKNEGEYSEFVAVDNIEGFTMGAVFDSVKSIYPFELHELEGQYRGRVLTQYLERFLDTFDKYLRDDLEKFIENPPGEGHQEITPKHD